MSAEGAPAHPAGLVIQRAAGRYDGSSEAPSADGAGRHHNKLSMFKISILS
jgi:hypothetical protein